jgi:hypothetical protein
MSMFIGIDQRLDRRFERALRRASTFLLKSHLFRDAEFHINLNCDEKLKTITSLRNIYCLFFVKEL